MVKAQVTIGGSVDEPYLDILSEEALEFLVCLHQKFDKVRKGLILERISRQVELQEGKDFEFPAPDHDSDWQVAPIPNELKCRHVEITGPVDSKMVINALNSGADVFMADFEDSLSPKWENVMNGQRNLKQANLGTLEFTNPNGSVRKIKENPATLFVRTRGWHLTEKNLLIDEQPLSGALMDFGLYFFHNIAQRLSVGSSVYMYLPKMETHKDCRLWREVFEFSEDYLKVPRGSIRVTIMVETLPAAVEMEEMLYELRDYACGMNAGRWDYIFSIIKRFQKRDDCILPDRSQIGMTVPFMRNYTNQLVKICHRHGAYAMGGMSAFIPSRRDEEVNRIAFQKVTEDKEREVADGFDGTWVAHPDLVKVVKKIFVDKLGKDNQLEKTVHGSVKMCLKTA